MTIRLQKKFSPFGKLMLGALVAAVVGLALPAFAAAAWTVNSTGDQTDATLHDGFCKTAANTCTLRAAIEESNAEGGSQEIFFGPTFNGGAGSAIALGSALPDFTPEKGEINGVSAGPCQTAAFVSGPCVEIDGTAGAKTLAATGAGEMVIKGLAVTGGAVGIEAASTLPGAHARTIEGNWIGKKLDGTAAPATSTGINVNDVATIEGNSISGGPVGIHAGAANSSGNTMRENSIAGATAAGILIENSSNQIYGNQVSNSAIGIRLHDSTVAADENKVGGFLERDTNTINGSTGAAIEVNTASSSTNNVLRNTGSGNGGPFISLVKKSAGESKGPNNGIQPPAITTATLTEASGTAEKESIVRVYGNATAGEGEMGTFLGSTEADPTTGAWSLTYSASAATAKIAASQTALEDEHGSSALSFTALPQSILKVLKAGTGSGTVTSAPAGINCGSTCEASFATGGLLKLIGAPATGSKAVTWTGCNAVNGGGECEVTMSAAKSVTATFDLVPSGGGGGGGGDTGGGPTGGDNNSGGQPPASNPSPGPAPAPPVAAKPKPLKCKAGFKKKTVKGKARCVKVKKAGKKH